MKTTASPAKNQTENRARGRFAFFSWFFALLGLGAAMLSLLLIGGGIVAWSSAVGLILVGLSLLGIVSLCAALGALFRARREREAAAPGTATGKAGR
jgi:hypothetical protein